MISVLGLAGSGKSTQGKLLARRLNCPWVSIGELLRTGLEGEARQQMLRGEIIDDHITLPILEHELIAKNASRDEVVVDGFPRNLSQAEWLAAKAKAGDIKMTGVIHLMADDNVALNRLLHRGRKDDTHDAIHQRFGDYERTIIPILNYLRERGLPVYDIDGNGTIDHVENMIDKALHI